MGYLVFLSSFLGLAILFFFLGGLKWKPTGLLTKEVRGLETKSSGSSHLSVVLISFLVIVLPTFQFRNESILFFWVSIFFSLVLFATWVVVAQHWHRRDKSGSDSENG